MTAPYVPLDPNAPSGPTQTPPQYSASDLANFRAVRDALVCGMGNPGYFFRQAPTNTITPNEYTWSNPTTGSILRAVVAYAGAPYYEPTSMTWWWSDDNGVTYAQIGPASTFLFDATSGALYGNDTQAGLFLLFVVARAKEVWNQVKIDQHIALTGNGVHGLGTMASQNANAVNISGGSISGVTKTAGVDYYAAILEAYRVTPGNAVNIANGANWDWSVCGPHNFAAPGIVINGIANANRGEIKRIWVQGAGAITINSNAGQSFGWMAGFPVFGNGTLISFVCVDTNYILGTTGRV